MLQNSAGHQRASAAWLPLDLGFHEVEAKTPLIYRKKGAGQDLPCPKHPPVKPAEDFSHSRKHLCQTQAAARISPKPACPLPLVYIHV